MSSGIAILGLASGALVLSSAALLWSASTTSNSLAKTPFHNTNSPVIILANPGSGIPRGIPRWENPLNSTPTPGIYKTFPSLAIVVVPDAGIDPKIIRNPTDCDPRMAKANPELRFVPWQTEPPQGKK